MQKTFFDKAEKKIVWLLDGAHKLVKKIELDWRNRSPMSGRWQIPQNVVTEEPTIEEKDGYDRIYENGKWAYIDKDDDSKKPETTTQPTQPTIKESVQSLQTEVSKLNSINITDFAKQMLAKGDANSWRTAIGAMANGAATSSDVEAVGGRTGYVRFKNGFTISYGNANSYYTGTTTSEEQRVVNTGHGSATRPCTVYHYIHAANINRNFTAIFWQYNSKGGVQGNRIIFEKSSTDDSRIDDTAPANVSWLVIGLS